MPHELLGMARGDLRGMLLTIAVTNKVNEIDAEKNDANHRYHGQRSRLDKFNKNK